MSRGVCVAVATAWAVFGLVGTADAQFQVRQTFLSDLSTGNASGGTVATDLENIDEGEALLAGAPGFVPSGNFTETRDVINYASTDFPGGTGEDFALEAVGVVDVIGGTSISGVSLYVNSDDGFRLRVNGVTVSEFTGLTGNSNTASGPLTLNDGDVLRLTFFERGGGDFLRLRLTDDNGPFVGADDSSIDIVPVPEPAGLALLAIPAALALGRRRRRNG